MKNKTCGKIALLTASTALLTVGSGATAFAAGTASDTAGNYTGGAWSTSPANNGTGFGAWSVNVQNNNNPPYAGTYLAGSGDTPIVDGSGNAWGVYANSAQGATLPAVIFTRPFTVGSVSGSSSLFNQTFSFDLGSGGVGPGQGLLSATVGNAFLLEYDGTGSSDSLQLGIDGGALNAINVGFTALNAGLNVSLAVSGALNSATENFTFTVSSFTGHTTLFTQSGTFNASAYNTSQFQFTDQNTAQNGYFNTLNITAEAVPEPTSMAIFAMSGLGALLALRRKK
jgi:PEP-CTERM motif